MTELEFSRDMDRLVGCFGERAYSGERIRVIFRAVEELSAAWWTRTVDDFIAYQRQPPLMGEIKEKVYAERERTWSNQKHQAPPEWTPPPNARCLDCRDSGIVFAKQKRTGNPYVFLCGCTAGRADRRAFPRWTSALLDQFDVLEAA